MYYAYKWLFYTNYRLFELISKYIFNDKTDVFKHLEMSNIENAYTNDELINVLLLNI